MWFGDWKSRASSSSKDAAGERRSLSKKKDPRQEALEGLSDLQLREALKKMQTQEITDLVKNATPYFKERILRSLSRETVVLVRGLLGTKPPGDLS
jgi:Mg/Co/Ni transporter MgtE